jgi:hypothetical protein
MVKDLSSEQVLPSKHKHLPSHVSIGTKFPGKAALHQVYFFPNLYIAFIIERLTNRWIEEDGHP